MKTDTLGHMPTTHASPLTLHPTSRPESQIPVPQLLREVNPKRVYVIEMPGNHGDKLSYLGMMFILESLGIKRTFRISNADMVLILGQATMTDMWGWGLLSLKTVLAKCPTTPIAVMPASYYLTETDLAAMFKDRKHRVVLFARDVESWDRIRAMDFPPCVEQYCDHDLAYYLRDTPYMQRLRRETESPEDYVLVVERWDPENPHLKIEMKPASGEPQLQTAWKLFLKSRFWRQKQAMVRLINPTRLKDEPSEAFRAECEHIIDEYEPWAKGLSWRVGDISDPRMHSIETFGSVIARSRLVISTRMHVGILAGMLGKKTYMRTGAFGKLSGGYAMSMYDWPNVQLFGEGGEVENAT